MRLACLPLAWLLAACASGATPTSNSTPTATAAPRPGCVIANAGPLIGYTYRDTPPPAPAAGRISDGVYDLVEIVRHTDASGPWSSAQMPSFRLALQFTTLETSSNHTSGRLDSAQEIPPRVGCHNRPFATVDSEIRVEDGTEGIDSAPYTTRGDLFTLHQGHGDGGDPYSYVFLRRH